jgi:predicted DNA-binding protein with PD1-like motif
MAINQTPAADQHVRVQSVTTLQGKQVLARLLPGTDLITGIEKICARQGIAQGAVISAIGTLSHATIVYVVNRIETPLGVKYVPPQKMEGPFELLGAQGFVGRNADDTLSVHLHGSLSGPDMAVYGGHFVKGGNPVLATAEIMLQALDGPDMARGYDEETGFELFKFGPEDED